MTTLEKVARALAVVDGELENDFAGYIIGARAALETLKGIPFKILEHPTEKVSRCASYDEALDFWNMTLDTILNEKA